MWSFVLVLTERHSTAAGDEQVRVTVQVKNHLDPNFESMTYYPTIYFNEFWMLRDHLIPVNDTVKEIQISLDLSQMPMWKFTIFSQVEKSFEMQVDLLHLLLQRSLHQKLRACATGDAGRASYMSCRQQPLTPLSWCLSSL